MQDNRLLLLTNAHVLTMDSSFHTFHPGSVLIRGSEILAVGLESEIKPLAEGAEITDCHGRILMPALVNAHSHVAMNLLRGLADDLRLDVWLLGYIMPVERQYVSPEFVRLGTLVACAEMIRSGIGTFCDMYYFEEEVARSAAEAGMRAVCSQTVMKYPTPDSETYESALDRAHLFASNWKDHALITPSIAPHAPYTCTPEILRASTEIAKEFDIPLHIHVSETAAEVENARRDWGMPVIPYLRKIGLLEAKVICAHCVHIDEGEIRSLQKVGAGVVHNPSSNLKLASGIAPLPKMLEIGVNVGIGTDGAASNNDLDMFEEIRLAALLAKGASGDPTAVPAKTALALGTRIGAQALHIGHQTGSLEKGKRADLLLLNLQKIHSNPTFERNPDGVYSQIVYSAKSSDVESLMVNGRWLMQDRELITLEETRLQDQAAGVAKKIDQFLVERESSVFSKLVAIESATEEQSHEIQIKVVLPSDYLLEEKLAHPEIAITRHRHYAEYDTYFEFDTAVQERLRYREDQILGETGEIITGRYRLTLTGPIHEKAFPHAVLLSRSRFLAQATHSLRFYREYFQPLRELELQKDRLRWAIDYQGTEFFINLDTVLKPKLPDRYLEIKCRTWSKRDAEQKSNLILGLLQILRLDNAKTLSQDYVELAKSPHSE